MKKNIGIAEGGYMNIMLSIEIWREEELWTKNAASVNNVRHARVAAEGACG